MSKPKTNNRGQEYKPCSVCGDYGWLEPGETECCLCERKEDNGNA